MREFGKIGAVWKPIGGCASTMSQVTVTYGLSVSVLFNA